MDPETNDLPFGRENFAYRSEQEPRDWQAEALAKFQISINSHGTAEQFRFTLVAGTGTGKTFMSAIIAADCLNRRLVERVVYVCPNRAIKRAVRRKFHEFGIDLVDWENKKFAFGEPGFFQGAVLSYQALASRPDLQRRLCRKRTLAIFDEIHHLGDTKAWADAAETAFKGAAAIVLGMSGTPYRSDNNPIPFVLYQDVLGKDGLRRFCADYTYTLGRAIVDGVCRKPLFRWLSGEVEIVKPDGARFTVDFQTELSEETANLRLAGAVKPGSPSRLNALEFVLGECRRQGRKLFIFVGGDTSSAETGIKDATVHLPTELASLGVGPEEVAVITSQSKNAIHQIGEFGKSPDQWILVTVNMLSEGVDIPEGSAALLLTTVTAKATTCQRIGRALRMSGDFDEALIYIFSDSRYVEYAKEIESEIKHEIGVYQRRKAPGQDVPGGADSFFRRAEANGLNARIDGLTFNGSRYTEEQVDRAIAYIEEKKLPKTFTCIGMLLTLWASGQGVRDGDAA